MFPPPGFSEPASQQQDNAKAIIHDAHAPAAHDCIYLNLFDEWGRIIIYLTSKFLAYFQWLQYLLVMKLVNSPL